MSKSAYVDFTAIVQVIGNVFNNPSLLEMTDKYKITDRDFQEEFHQVVFGSIYNISKITKTVTVEAILDYLAVRPKYEAIFKQNNGVEYLKAVSASADKNTFNYYYSRLKKMTLLREYDKIGLDLKEFYDPNNILDVKKKQEQEDWLDFSSLEDIATAIDNKIEAIKMECVHEVKGKGFQAGENVIELIEDLEESPEMGIPLYGRLINTVTRGARLKKFYLRSAATGVGKTRALIADMCYISCDEIYYKEHGWVKNGVCQPSLFIATEQDLSEVQTMMLAFISGVNEEHILNGAYEEGERDRVIKAAGIIKNAPLWVEELPDFSIQDIEDKIKYHIREHDVLYVGFDYIHVSLKILEEITKKSGGTKMREDNVLFILSTRLKDMCNQYGIFIISATQLNAMYQDSDTPDQNLLRGAKSIADRIDVGEIILSVTNDDLVKLDPITATGKFPIPNLKISIYKNRRGRYKGIYLWCEADLGTCRINPSFATNWNYEIIPIEDIKITLDPPPWSSK